MSGAPEPSACTARFPKVKAIYCVLPDDGTDKRMLVALRQRYGIVTAGSALRKGMSVLAEAKTKRGKLPEAELVKQLFIICAEDEAEEVFEFVFWSAQLDKPGRGIMWQQSMSVGTPYELPPNMPDEDVGH